MKKNYVQITGAIGANAELQVSEGGKKYTRISVATSRSKKNDDGKWIELEPNWFNITFFNDLSLRAAQLQKGDFITVEARLIPTVRELEEGTKVYSYDIVGKELARVDFMNIKPEANSNKELVENELN